MAGARPRICCRSLFKQPEILPVLCQYMHSLMNFIIKNHEIFQTNSSVHNITTWNKHHFHRSNANPSCYQKKYILRCIKMFDCLPSCITIFKNGKAKFKAALKKYLHIHSFYSVDEFLCVKMIYNTVFVKCFIVFYTVRFYTCSTSCCLYDTLMDPRNVYMCVHRYILDSCPSISQVQMLHFSW